MERITYRDPKPKKPIGQKHRPVRSTEYEPREDYSVYIKRIKMRYDE